MKLFNQWWIVYVFLVAAIPFLLFNINFGIGLAINLYRKCMTTPTPIWVSVDRDSIHVNTTIAQSSSCPRSETANISIAGLDYDGNTSSGSAIELGAGVIHEFGMISLDKYGKPRCLGGDYFEVDLSSDSWKSRPLLKDHGNGNYSLYLQVHPEFVGRYILNITLPYRGLEALNFTVKQAEPFKFHRQMRSFVVNFYKINDQGSSNSLVFPDLPVCTSKDFSKQAWNGRWTRHDWNHSCKANPVGRFMCLDQNTSCHLPWCQGYVGALESNGWVYSAHCSFRIFTQVAAWNCLKGKWLFFSGDSNHVDTTRNMLILALGIPGHFLTTRRFDKKYQNPNNSSEEVRITSIFNGHSNENLNGWGMESFRDAGFQRLNRRYFSGNTAPDVVIFNSGLHDGLHNTTLPQFIQTAEYTVNFWSTMFKDLTLKNIKPPIMIYRTTIAAASEKRYWGTNPHKMEVYNAVLGEQLKLKGLLTNGRVVDNFDMTFPWHYDLRCSDGIHYGGLPTPAEWTQGGIARHYFVDLMLIHVLLNAICLK